MGKNDMWILPGSDKAKAKGCVCPPTKDKNNLLSSMKFWITPTCPIHGTKKGKRNA